MVVVSRQYFSGADKAVQNRLALFVDKGPQPELRHNKSEIALSIRMSDFLRARLCLVQTFYVFQYCSTFCAQTTGLMCLEALTF